MKINLIKLTEKEGLAGQIQVVCAETKQRKVWNDAARSGWVFDSNGIPFQAYYSPQGSQILLARSK